MGSRKQVGLRKPRILIALLIFITACITSIDNVVITGLFSDPAGLNSVPAGDVQGTVYIGVHVDFTYNPFLDPNPSSHIGESFFIRDSAQNDTGIPGAFNSTTFPDGNYQLFATAYAFGIFDTAPPRTSDPYPITIHNHRGPMVTNGPGPQDGGDPNNDPSDSGGGPPETCPGPDGTPVACLPYDGPDISDQPKDCG